LPNRHALAAQLGRQPTDEEVAKLARLPVRQVREVKSAARTVTSLDKPIGEEQPMTLEEVVHRLGISRNRVRKLEAEGLSRLAQRREIAALDESLEFSS
jgi:DNA-directed RNA polymerase sigma subunit (sigma70/sigma32)